jgi:hypothetical protein
LELPEPEDLLELPEPEHLLELAEPEHLLELPLEALIPDHQSTEARHLQRQDRRQLMVVRHLQRQDRRQNRQCSCLADLTAPIQMADPGPAVPERYSAEYLAD